MGTETQHLPPSGGSEAGREGTASALGKETPGLQPRLPEASGGSRTGHVWWGMWLSRLCCVPIGQEPATCLSVDQPLLAQLPPLCLRALGPLCAWDLSPLLLPLMLAPSSLREGSCPEKQPFPLCPAMTRSHLSSGNRAGLLDPGAQWPPRHPGTWTCGTGHWVNQEQSDHSPALPLGGSSGQARAGGHERVLSCPQPLTLQIPPLGEWGAWPWGPSFVCPGPCPPRPSLPPPWLWHR